MYASSTCRALIIPDFAAAICRGVSASIVAIVSRKTERCANHSGSMSACCGHASIHLPQSTHFSSASFSLKLLSSEKTSRGQMLIHAPQSTHSLSFTLMPCSRRCTVAPRLIIVSLTSWHWSSGTSMSASPSDESMIARSTLIRTPVSRTDLCDDRFSSFFA